MEPWWARISVLFGLRKTIFCLNRSDPSSIGLDTPDLTTLFCEWVESTSRFIKSSLNSGLTERDSSKFHLIKPLLCLACKEDTLEAEDEIWSSEIVEKFSIYKKGIFLNIEILKKEETSRS